MLFLIHSITLISLIRVMVNDYIVKRNLNIIEDKKDLVDINKFEIFGDMILFHETSIKNYPCLYFDYLFENEKNYLHFYDNIHDFEFKNDGLFIETNVCYFLYDLLK